MKKLREKGITLVALIITIIILLILAGIIIGQLTENGIFENAKTAKEKYENSQEQENQILEQYEDKITSYTRSGFTKIQELIDTNDNLYNSTEKGYVFDTYTSYGNVTTNNTINLSESIENYDYLFIDVSSYSVYESDWLVGSTIILPIKQIKEKYTNIDTGVNGKKFFLTYDIVDIANRITVCFKNNNTIKVVENYSNTSDLTKLKITNITGVKY